jgi:hypothetical protein
MWVAEKSDWKGLNIKKSIENRKIIMSDFVQPLSRPKKQELGSMRVAEKLDRKGLKIKKSVGNRKIVMSDEARHRIGKG